MAQHQITLLLFPRSDCATIARYQTAINKVTVGRHLVHNLDFQSKSALTTLPSSSVTILLPFSTGSAHIPFCSERNMPQAWWTEQTMLPTSAGLCISMPVIAAWHCNRPQPGTALREGVSTTAPLLDVDVHGDCNHWS